LFTIYTVGHSTHSHEHFLELIKSKDINCVVDVRSVPFSRYANNYNKDVIKAFLNRNHLIYLYMGEELGARQSSPSLYTPEGYLDFEKTSKSKIFLSGIKRIMDGLEKKYSITLMCTEKDPIECHRAILVAKELIKNGCTVIHIMDNGQTQTQDQLEQRMLDHYFPNWGQQSLFEEVESNLSRDELILKAYQLKNKEIGYSLNSGQKEVDL